MTEKPNQSNDSISGGRRFKPVIDFSQKEIMTEGISDEQLEFRESNIGRSFDNVTCMTNKATGYLEIGEQLLALNIFEKINLNLLQSTSKITTFAKFQ